MEGLMDKNKKKQITQCGLCKGNGKSAKGGRNWFRNKTTNPSLGTQFLYLFKGLLLHLIKFSLKSYLVQLFYFIFLNLSSFLIVIHKVQIFLSNNKTYYEIVEFYYDLHLM